MTDVTQGNTASFTLAAGEQVYIKTAGAAVVKYGRLLPKSPSVVQLTSADSEVRYGPYPVEMLFEVSATTGTLTYSDSATVIQRLPDDGSDLSAKFNAVADALGAGTGNMSPDNIGESVRLTVKSVDDVSALRATEPFYDGQQIELLGHTTAGIGGGVFHYDAADTTTADDNGVTIVAAGGKRWKRKLEGFVTPEMFGGGSSGFVSACEFGMPVDLDGGKTYTVTDTVYRHNAPLKVNGNGATIVKADDSEIFFVELDYLNIQAVTSISAVTIDLTKGQGGAVTPTHRLTVADASAYSIGNIVKIVSDDLIEEGRPGDNEKKGEHALVVATTSTTITLSAYLFETYTTNIRVGQMQTGIDVEISDIILDTDGSVNPTWSETFLRFRGCYKAKVNNVRALRTRAEFITFESCLAHETNNINAKSLNTDFANFAYGYGIFEQSCESGRHVAPHIIDARHAYTDGTYGSVADNGEFYRYGRTKNTKVVGGIGEYCQNAAWDTHYTSFNIQFIGCHGERAYNGPSAGMRNFQMRSRSGKCVDCTSVGGRGYVVSQEADHPLAAANNEFINCYHEFAPIEQNLEAFSVNGYPGGSNPPSAKIVNPVTYQTTGDDTHILADNANVIVSNINLTAKMSGSFTGKVIAATNGSSVRVKGGDVDFTGSSGSGNRLATVFDSASVIDIDGVTVSSDVAWSIGDMTNNAGVYRVSVDTNIAPNAISNAASANVTVDYTVDGARTSDYSNYAVTYAAGGVKSVDNGNRGGDVISLTMTVNATGASIGSITAGKRVGQILILRNAAASGFSITLTNGGTNITIGSDEVIAIGRAFRLYWNGSSWVAA